MSKLALVLFIYLLSGGISYADQEIWLPPKEPNPFSKSYLFVGVLQNIPLKDSTEYFERNSISGEFGYKFNMDLNWMVNVSFGGKAFESTDADENVILAYISSGAEYITRLSYPFYLTLGYRLYYFVPTDGRSVPISTSGSFSPELGFGINSSLYYIYDKGMLAFVSIERWKGTGSKKLNGLEAKLSFAYSI